MSGEIDFFPIFQLGLPMLPMLLLLLGALLFSCYVKIVTVLAILRVGLGFYSIPSAFITGGLAFSLAFFVMYPTVYSSVSTIEKGVTKVNGKLSDKDRVQIISDAMQTWKQFITQHTHKDERRNFIDLAKRLDAKKQVAETEEVKASSENKLENSWRVLAPAFLVSELKEAFTTGLSLFLPFLVIEILVSVLLASTGLTQISPHMISFPLKLLLFVALDGWTAITTNLAQTYI